MSYPTQTGAPPAFEENKPLNPPVINQPPQPIQSQPLQQQQPNTVQSPRDFQYGLFDCFSNCGLCCIVYFVPCVPFGEISQETGYGQCVSHGIMFWCCYGVGTPCLLGLQRGHVKKTLGIHEGSACGDFCISCWCPLCVLCQMAKETSKYNMGEDRDQTIARV